MVTFESAVILSNYNEAWRKNYDASQYGLIDPMVLKSFSQVLPIIWSEAEYKTVMQKEFYEEAASFGYKSGVTIPLHGPRGEVGTLSFSMNETEAFESSRKHIHETLAELVLIRDLSLGSFLPLLDRARQQKELQSEQYILSDRAVEILTWCALGKTSWEISKICGCSEANINFHLNKARRLLGVHSRKAATIKAYSLGLISL